MKARIALLDVARGVAILAMIVYHFTWDLGYLHFIALDVTVEPGWIAFQKLIVGTFLFLTGISLALAHGDNIRWSAFWRRFALISGAALLVTVGTYVFSAESFVYFGVLHAIALFGLFALAFLRAPYWVLGSSVAFFLILPLFIQSPLFADRVLSWIGLWDVPPPTEDLVPVFPWFGVVLAGVFLARLGMDKGIVERLSNFSAGSAASRALVWLGRWSLVIYLVHQPLLLGGLTILSTIVKPWETRQAEDFVSSCEVSCYESSGYAAYCTAYCACALERIVTEDLWGLLDGERDAEQEGAVLDLTNQCAAQVIELQQ